MMVTAGVIECKQMVAKSPFEGYSSSDGCCL